MYDQPLLDAHPNIYVNLQLPYNFAVLYSAV
jgi:hypothetical protein